MRILALICLCSCAPVVTAIPSSLPYVRVDDTLAGAVVSREAAIAILSRQELKAAQCRAREIDCEARVRTMQTQRDSETKRANENAWWSIYGPGLFGGGVAVSFIVGGVVGVLFGGLIK